jgi:zinc protease
VKAFHAGFYGPAQATLVAVGDIDIDALKAEVAKAFEGWSGGKPRPEFPEASPAPQRREQTIAMADKPNVTVKIGQTTGHEIFLNRRRWRCAWGRRRWARDSRVA